MHNAIYIGMLKLYLLHADNYESYASKFKTESTLKYRNLLWSLVLPHNLFIFFAVAIKVIYKIAILHKLHYKRRSFVRTLHLALAD